MHIEEFMRENRLFDVYSYVNNIDIQKADNTHIKGQKQIDAVIDAPKLLEVIHESKLINYKEIIDTDHKGFLIDIGMQEYFDIKHSEYEHADNATLNLTKQSHRNKHQEKLEECIEQLDLENTVN